MNKAMFENTKWDVREWTDDMKQKWNSRVQVLGFAGLHDDTLFKSIYIWLDYKSTAYLDLDDSCSLKGFTLSVSKEMKYKDMFPDEKEGEVEAKKPSLITIQALEEAKQIKRDFTSAADIFAQMKNIAKENSMFISFDGLNDDEEDVIVVTHVSSDTEYVVNSLEEFNQLTQSFKALEKFERKI